MKRLLLTLALCCTVCHAAAKKDQKSSSVPHFTSGTTLVLIPTTVTDPSGVHIEGLKREDFTVLEDHRERKIAVFEEFKTSAAEVPRVGSKPGVFTNQLEGDSTHRRLTMIVYDTLNTRFEDQSRARRELLRFLQETLHPDEPVALLTLGGDGLKVISGFTADPKTLISALAKVRGQVGDIDNAALTEQTRSIALANEDQLRKVTKRAAGSTPAGRSNQFDQQSFDELDQRIQSWANASIDKFEQAQDFRSLERTLNAMRQVGEFFSGVPGRKNLIWVTGGMPVTDADYYRVGGAQIYALYQATWDALSRSQVAVYPMDMGSLVNTYYVSPAVMGFSRYRPRVDDSVYRMEQFAAMTGGKLCVHKSTLASCYEDANRDASHYYLLGYYVDANDTKTGWRSLDVRVDRAGKVRARSGYMFAPHGSDPKAAQREAAAAFLSPVDFTGIPLNVQVDSVQPGSAAPVTFHYAVPAGSISCDRMNQNHIDVTFAALARDAKGNMKGDFSKQVVGDMTDAQAAEVAAKGLSFDGAIALPPGKYTLRLVVRDNIAGKIGSVSAETGIPGPK